MLYKLVRALTAFVVKTFSNTVVYGRENLLSGNVVYICNHQSMVDAFITYCVLPENTYFMAKKQLFKIALFKRSMLKIKMFPVDRGTADLHSIRYACECLQNNGNLCIFPQGTRKKQPEILSGDLHSGAAMIALKKQSTVIPLMFKDKPQLFKTNVLYIGKPLALEDYMAKGVKTGNMNELTAFFAESMNLLLETEKSRCAVK